MVNQVIRCRRPGVQQGLGWVITTIILTILTITLIIMTNVIMNNTMIIMIMCSFNGIVIVITSMMITTMIITMITMTTIIIRLCCCIKCNGRFMIDFNGVVGTMIMII